VPFFCVRNWDLNVKGGRGVRPYTITPALLARVFDTDRRSVLLNDPKYPQSDLPRLAGGTMPFMRRYSTICP
jgi:hypothetical protein